jgi:hypothetical protein
MQIEIVPSSDIEARERGMLDVVFRRTEARSTVVTMSKDEVLDLREEIGQAIEDGDLFKGYEEPDDFEMFSAAANRLVDEMCNELETELAKNIMDEDQARAFLDTRMDRIAAVHGEIWDTNVRECIADTVSDSWKLAFGLDIENF